MAAKKTTPKTAPPAQEENTAAEQAAQSLKLRESIPLTTLVPCVNMTRGRLVYTSGKQQGYQVIWAKFGDVEYLELSELVSMRNSVRKFFVNNWIWIEDSAILKFLGVEKLYTAALPPDQFDDVFRLSPAALQKRVSAMSAGMKMSVGIRAMELVQNGKLDSLKVIKALEDALGYEIIEH